MIKIKEKAKIRNIGTDLKIIIPAEKNPKFLFFSIFWFISWYFIYRFASSVDEIFLRIWLILWTIACLIMILILLWYLFGYEELRISQSKMILSISLFGLKYNRIITKRAFRSCTFSEEEMVKRDLRKNIIYLSSPAKIKIENNYKDYFIGSALGDVEAKKLVGVINNRFN